MKRGAACLLACSLIIPSPSPAAITPHAPLEAGTLATKPLFVGRKNTGKPTSEAEAVMFNNLKEVESVGQISRRTAAIGIGLLGIGAGIAHYFSKPQPLPPPPADELPFDRLERQIRAAYQAANVPGILHRLFDTRLIPADLGLSLGGLLQAEKVVRELVATQNVDLTGDSAFHLEPDAANPQVLHYKVNPNVVPHLMDEARHGFPHEVVHATELHQRLMRENMELSHRVDRAVFNRNRPADIIRDSEELSRMVLQLFANLLVMETAGNYVGIAARWLELNHGPYTPLQEIRRRLEPIVATGGHANVDEDIRASYTTGTSDLLHQILRYDYRLLRQFQPGALTDAFRQEVLFMIVFADPIRMQLANALAMRPVQRGGYHAGFNWMMEIGQIRGDAATRAKFMTWLDNALAPYRPKPTALTASNA